MGLFDERNLDIPLERYIDEKNSYCLPIFYWGRNKIVYPTPFAEFSCYGVRTAQNDYCGYFVRKLDSSEIESCDFYSGCISEATPWAYSNFIRPAFSDDNIFYLMDKTWEFINIFEKLNTRNGVKKVTYGEYPQDLPSKKIQNELENAFMKNTLKKTGRSYTFNKLGTLDRSEKRFEPIIYEEYEYQEKKYIRYKSVPYKERYSIDNYLWIEVSPVVWIVDYQTKQLFSEKCLLGGIAYQHNASEEEKDYYNSFLYEYLNTYMIRDLFQTSRALSKRKIIPDSTIKVINEALSNKQLDWFNQQKFKNVVKCNKYLYHENLMKEYSKGFLDLLLHDLNQLNYDTILQTIENSLDLFKVYNPERYELLSKIYGTDLKGNYNGYELNDYEMYLFSSAVNYFESLVMNHIKNSVNVDELIKGLGYDNEMIMDTNEKTLKKVKRF